MIPSATYRIQFRNGMTFDRAAALAPIFRGSVSAIFTPRRYLRRPPAPPMAMILPILTRSTRPSGAAKGLIGW